MKNVLDHRILLPKAPEVVWQYISDLSNNTLWQVDCKQVSFITSRHSGAGVRWRYQSTDNLDRVVETTAWYEGLGYEYSFVEGTPFQENRGRIRLQEIPEGTVVQWTFSYDTKGFLGGVRNTLNIRRQTENVMIESLRMLWRKLNQSNPAETVREVKSLIRDAPGYEERSRYKPRHPSKTEVEAQSEPVNPPPQPIIVEPPVTDEDTRPSIRVVPASELDFLSEEPESPDKLPVVVEEESLAKSPFAPPEQPVTQVEEAQTQPDESLTPQEPVQSIESPDVEHPTEPAGDDVQKLEAEPEKLVLVTSVTSDPSHDEPTKASEEPAAEAVESDLSKETTKTPVVNETLQETSGAATQTALREPVPPEKLDTREVSVFEIFGLPKPSETQELAAVVYPTVQPEATPAPGRVGLRILLRRKRVKVRRPA